MSLSLHSYLTIMSVLEQNVCNFEDCKYTVTNTPLQALWTACICQQDRDNSHQLQEVSYPARFSHHNSLNDSSVTDTWTEGDTATSPAQIKNNTSVRIYGNSLKK